MVDQNGVTLSIINNVIDSLVACKHPPIKYVLKFKTQREL